MSGCSACSTVTWHATSAIGHEAAGAEMSYCPLTLRGVETSVRSVGEGFAVSIRSDDLEIQRLSRDPAPHGIFSTECRCEKVTLRRGSNP